MMMKLLERFKKKFAKSTQKDFRFGKVIKKKGVKLYVKWKGYNNFLNNWIDKIDRVSTFLDNFRIKCKN